MNAMRGLAGIAALLDLYRPCRFGGPSLERGVTPVVDRL